MTDLPGVSARLKERLDNLERRVSILEHPNVEFPPVPDGAAAARRHRIEGIGYIHHRQWRS